MITTFTIWWCMHSVWWNICKQSFGWNVCELSVWRNDYLTTIHSNHGQIAHRENLVNVGEFWRYYGRYKTKSRAHIVDPYGLAMTFVSRERNQWSVSITRLWNFQGFNSLASFMPTWRSGGERHAFIIQVYFFQGCGKE